MMEQRITGISSDLIIHPGETLQEILETRGISQEKFANSCGVTQTFLCDVIEGRANISDSFASALERTLGVSESFWKNLQAHYDKELTEYQSRLCQ